MAFHAGVLLALHHDLGWDARDADVIVGTSAGSIVGALLRVGVTPEDLAAWATDATPTQDGRKFRALMLHADRLGPVARVPLPTRPGWVAFNTFAHPTQLRAALDECAAERPVRSGATVRHHRPDARSVAGEAALDLGRPRRRRAIDLVRPNRIRRHPHRSANARRHRRPPRTGPTRRCRRRVLRDSGARTARPDRPPPIRRRRCALCDQRRRARRPRPRSRDRVVTDGPYIERRLAVAIAPRRSPSCCNARYEHFATTASKCK